MPQPAIWRGLLDGFLQLVSVFIEASQNFFFSFLHNKAAKNLKTIGANTYLIFKTFKVYSSCDTIPLSNVKSYLLESHPTILARPSLY
jgi:hypothetical protein